MVSCMTRSRDRRAEEKVAKYLIGMSVPTFNVFQELIIMNLLALLFPLISTHKAFTTKKGRKWAAV